MLKIKKKGKYFLKDSELANQNLDEFKHEDISENIINIIETEEPPYNVAVVGKWGLGKSSLVRFVTKHFEPNKDYVITEINAWKYEKEALRRVFIRQVLLGLGYNDENYVKKFMESLRQYKGNAGDDHMEVKDYFKEWGPIIFPALAIYLLIFIFQIIRKFISGDIASMDLRTFFFTSVSGTIYIPIFVVLIQQFIKASSGKYTFKLASPVTTTDEYEDILKKILKKDKRRIITVIDDLDRLTPEKIVEALDAIKAFVNYDNCIFLVPFDDSILKNAINNKKVLFKNNENLTIEGDLFLDKLFQYKMFLPNIILSNIPKYAIELCHNEIKDFCELCGNDLFDKVCREILIHKSVSTPRQVKKIINAFVNNVLLAYRREDNYLKEKTLTSENGIKILAKISVLQADFSSFYSHLFTRPSLINDFIAFSESNGSNKEDQLLLQYFNIEKKDDTNSVFVKHEYVSLLNFLKRTSNVRCEDISEYIYLSQDQNSILFGSEISRELRDSVTSGSYQVVRTILESNKDDFTELLTNILIYSEPYEYSKSIISLINTYDCYENYQCTNLINQIAAKASSTFENGDEFECENVKFDNLVKIYSLCQDKTGLNNLICQMLKTLDKKSISRIEEFFKMEEVFSEEVKGIITQQVSEEIGINSNLPMDEFFSIDSLNLNTHFNRYLHSSSLIKTMSEYIEKNEHLDENNIVFSSFYKLIEIYSNRNEMNEILPVFVEKMNNERFISLLYIILHKHSKQINKDMGTKLVGELVKINDEELYDKVNILLKDLKWKITDTIKLDVDRYLKENYDKEILNNIIIDIIDSNEIEFIPDTISKINTTILENESIYLETIDRLQSNYTESQKEEIFDVIDTEIHYSQKISDDAFARARTILDVICNDDNKSYVDDLITNIYNQFVGNPGNSYCRRLIRLIECTLNVKSESRRKFIDWANSSSHMANYITSSIFILDILINEIPQDIYMSIGDNVMQNCTSDVLEESLRILRVVRSAFKNGTSQITDYKNFLLKFIDNNLCRRDIIKDMGDNYLKIGKIDEYVAKTIVYDDISDLVVNTTVKFIINSYDNIEGRIDAIHEIMNSVDSEYMNYIEKIIIELFGEETINVVKQLVSNVTDEEKLSYIFNLFHLIVADNNNYKDNIVWSLLKILLNQGDLDIVFECLQKCSEYREFKDNTIKKEIADSLYKIFRESPDSDDKSKIYEYVKALKLNYSFNRSNSLKREFTDDEQKIIRRK